MSEPIEEKIGKMLKDRQFTLAVAESCTGGLLGHRLVSVPGSSSYFLGSIVAYADLAKERFLNVSAETLQRYGAVSEQTVEEMVRGVHKAFHADTALAITGIAGPDSDYSGKPVGLTWIAAITPEGLMIERHDWEGDRQANMTQSVDAALHLLLNALESAS